MNGPVAKLVDAPDLGSGAAMCESSSLSGPNLIDEISLWQICQRAFYLIIKSDIYFFQKIKYLLKKKSLQQQVEQQLGQMHNQGQDFRMLFRICNIQ